MTSLAVRVRGKFVAATLGLAFVSTVSAIGSLDLDALPAAPPTLRTQYGDGPLQFGELRVPDGPGPFPLAIVIHGGCWTAGFATLRNTAPIASALAQRGIATWNIEYRQLGDPGGGWPNTFLDWAAASDFVQVIAKVYPIDLDRIVVTGHSAGAYAALWVAARSRLSTENVTYVEDPLKLHGVVAIDGPDDPAEFIGQDEKLCGKPVVAQLLGATPDEEPERYRQASPRRALPLGVPQVLVSAAVLHPQVAREYASRAIAKGDKVEVIELKTGHFEPIAPGDKAWREVEDAIVRMTRS